LYFVLQSMLISPQTQPLARQLYEESHSLLINTFKDIDLLEGLVEVRTLVERDRVFEALKKLRALYPVEAELLPKLSPAPDTQAA
jgi:flagellar biosynthesis repressor protein FlbT